MTKTAMLNPNWLLTDDIFMKPDYRISPFTTASVAENSQCKLDSAAEQYFESHLHGYQQTWVRKAREAITLALLDLNLMPTDVVSILTTSQNFYVSGCVTKSVEQVCEWNRELIANTKAILVIHEFGSIFRNLNALYATGIPIIEDYAHAFHSIPPEGIKGDYIIYSFPKYFSIQYGGILLSKRKLTQNYELPVSMTHYLKAVVSEKIKKIEQYRHKRIKNHHYLEKAFSAYECKPRFDWQSFETPSVFIFHVPINVCLSELKIFIQKHGIEASVFYGEQVFFIPVHHGLNEVDLDYFSFVYEKFINMNGIQHAI